MKNFFSVRVLIPVALVVATLFIAGFYFFSLRKLSPPPPDQVVAREVVKGSVAPPSASTTETLPQASQMIIYKNSKYGFELTLPEQWKDYQVHENENALSFRLRLNEPQVWDSGEKVEYGHVFFIKAFSRAEWVENQNAGDPSVMNFLGENEQYVFGYQKGQDDEGFAGFPKVSESGLYHGPFYEVDSIIIPSLKLE